MHTTSKPTIAHVAIAGPFWQCFDYRVPESMLCEVGARVSVPFGRRQCVGMVVAMQSETSYQLHKLKNISEVLDDKPILTPTILKTLKWASQYYSCPLGEAIFSALPNKAKQSKFAL